MAEDRLIGMVGSSHFIAVTQKKMWKISFLTLFFHVENRSFKREKPNLKLSSRTGLLKYMSPPLMAAVLTLSPLCCSTPVSYAELVDIQRGAALFNKACIGCHDGGGNILQPGATLFMEDLQRNGVDTEEGLYGITYYGKGRMPGFGEKCMPRGQCTFGPRLQDEEIKLLASFVKLQAEKGWPNVAN